MVPSSLTHILSFEMGQIEYHRVCLLDITPSLSNTLSVKSNCKEIVAFLVRFRISVIWLDPQKNTSESSSVLVLVFAGVGTGVDCDGVRFPSGIDSTSVELEEIDSLFTLSYLSNLESLTFVGELNFSRILKTFSIIRRALLISM